MSIRMKIVRNICCKRVWAPLVLGIDVNQNEIVRLILCAPNAAHPDNRGVGPRTKRVARGTTAQEVRGRPLFVKRT